MGIAGWLASLSVRQVQSPTVGLSKQPSMAN